MISLQDKFQRKNTFRCVPIAVGLPIIFFILTLPQIYWMIFGITQERNDISVFFGCMTVLSLLFAVFTLPKAAQRIIILPTIVICRGILPQSAFYMNYDQCCVGMDYHIQNGNKVWWIYLCIGPTPKYKGKNPVNRINTVKIRPGFVRIMYSDAVYDALITVLPKKQKTALETSRRCAGFEKQGKIFF